MAVEGTKIFNKDYKQIFPVSKAEAIYTYSSGSEDSVESCLKQLFKTISDIGGVSGAAENIVINTYYCKTNTSSKQEVIELDQWADLFVLPDADNPYVWKKTEFSYKGSTEEANIAYEIVATDLGEKNQTIYISRSTSVAPVISYPILKDGYGSPILDEFGHTQEDLNAYNSSLPDGWSEQPASISPSTPYVFMATRKRVGGKWGRFSEPAQYGRWAFDSLFEVRYAVTDGATPSVNFASENPGSNWSSTSPTSFTGKLWIITATSVNGVLNSDESGNIWKGPNLISIVQ